MKQTVIAPHKWPSGRKQPVVEKLTEQQLETLHSQQTCNNSSTLSSFTSPTGTTIYWSTTAGTGGCGCSSNNVADPIYNSHTTQWAVKGHDGHTHAFDNQDEAEEYSRNMMMAGITHYPDQVHHHRKSPPWDPVVIKDDERFPEFEVRRDPSMGWLLEDKRNKYISYYDNRDTAVNVMKMMSARRKHESRQKMSTRTKKIKVHEALKQCAAMMKVNQSSSQKQTDVEDFSAYWDALNNPLN